MESNFRTYDPERFNMRSVLNRIHPVCGYSLQTAAKLIGAIQMGLFALGAAAALLCTVIVTIQTGNGELTHRKLKDLNSPTYLTEYKLGMKTLILLLTMLTVFCILLFLLARMLYRGAKERNEKKLTLWWRITFGITVVCIAQNIIVLIALGLESSLGDLEIIEVLINLYTLWVVHEFKYELQQSSESTTVEFDRVLQMP